MSTTIKYPKIAPDFSEAPKGAWSQNSIKDYLYPLSFICSAIFAKLLVFNVTLFKIGQNKSQNHSTDKVQNLANERR